MKESRKKIWKTITMIALAFGISLGISLFFKVTIPLWGHILIGLACAWIALGSEIFYNSK